VTAAIAAAHAGRALAESLMLDDCKVTRPASTTVIDPTTGLPTAPAPTVIYGGTGDHSLDKCKIQSSGVETVNPDSGQHVYTVQRPEVHFPVSAAGIKVGDLVEITASVDPANGGRKFTITRTFRKTLATAQRLPVEEIVA
jgi:hypothetical protein